MEWFNFSKLKQKSSISALSLQTLKLKWTWSQKTYTRYLQLQDCTCPANVHTGPTLKLFSCMVKLWPINIRCNITWTCYAVKQVKHSKIPPWHFREIRERQRKRIYFKCLTCFFIHNYISMANKGLSSEFWWGNTGREVMPFSSAWLQKKELLKQSFVWWRKEDVICWSIITESWDDAQRRQGPWERVTIDYYCLIST